MSHMFKLQRCVFSYLLMLVFLLKEEQRILNVLLLLGAISKMTTGNSKLLCNSCLELRQSQVSPGQVVTTDEPFLDQVSVAAQASPDQAAVAEQASAGAAAVSPRRYIVFCCFFGFGQ